MSHSIRITIPGEQDLQYFEKIGHIVFKMDELANDEEICKRLLAHLSITGQNDSEDPQTEDEQQQTITIEQINNKAEI